MVYESEYEQHVKNFHPPLANEVGLAGRNCALSAFGEFFLLTSPTWLTNPESTRPGQADEGGQ